MLVRRVEGQGVVTALNNAIRHSDPAGLIVLQATAVHQPYIHCSILLSLFANEAEWCVGRCGGPIENSDFTSAPTKRQAARTSVG